MGKQKEPLSQISLCYQLKRELVKTPRNPNSQILQSSEETIAINEPVPTHIIRLAQKSRRVWLDTMESVQLKYHWITEETVKNTSEPIRPVIRGSALKRLS